MTGVEVRGGKIFCDPVVDKTKDLLHEDGHIAILPSRFRPFATGDVDDAMKPHFEAYMAEHSFIDEDGNEDPVIRGMLQARETEAIAWSWAAGKHLGVPEEEIMPDDGVFTIGYDPDRANEPGGAETRDSLRFSQYLGINGLQAAGMTATNVMKIRDGVPGFPAMLKWMQD